jgi:hypothetical protein
VKTAAAREVRAEWEPLLRQRDARIRELEGRFSRAAETLREVFAIELIDLKTPTAEKANTGNARSVGRTDRIQSIAPAPERNAPAQRVEAGNRPPASPSALSGPEQRIIDAIAWLESIGVTEPEQTAVAFLAGYTIGGGSVQQSAWRASIEGPHRIQGRPARTDRRRQSRRAISRMARSRR